MNGRERHGVVVGGGSGGAVTADAYYVFVTHGPDGKGLLGVYILECVYSVNICLYVCKYACVYE